MSDLRSKKAAYVIDLFLNLENNTARNIAEISELQLDSVHLILNKYLNSKTING